MIKVIAALALCASLFTSCASRGEIESFQQDFTIIKEHLQVIEQRQSRQDSLFVDRMNLLRQRLLEGQTVLRQLKADQLTGQEELAELILQIRAGIEDADAYNQRLAKKVDELNILLARQGLKQDRDTLASADPQWLYNQATLDRYRGFPQLARLGYKEYIARFPDGTMRAACSYWLAETWMAEQQADSALAQLDLFLKIFPKDDLQGDALLKRALLLAAKGEIETAREIYRALIKDNPGSTVARLAQERLTD
jgi:TolA-binding protein